MKTKVTVCVFLGISLLYGSAHAVCVPTAATHNNKNGEKLYRINTANASLIGMTADDFIQAVNLGAHVWNEQGNGGFFTFDGETTDTDLPSSGCTTDYSIVRISNSCNSLIASNTARCSGDQFVVNVFRQDNDNSCADYNYGNGQGSTTILDMAGLITHEFGHSQGIGDQTTADCTMHGATFSTFLGVLHRDLYERDLSQSFDCSGRRELVGKKMIHNGSGFSSTSTFTGTFDVTKASSGLAYDGGTGYFASVFHGGSSIQWDEGANGSSTTISSVGATNGIGLVSGLWREDSATDRMFYSYWEDDGTNMTANHLLRTVTSTDEFATAPTISNLNHCSAMSGWMTCSGTNTNAHSGGRVSVGYLADINESVTVWIDQDHSSSGSGTNEIMIAVGQIDNDTLPEPTSTGLFSSVPPGVACLENFSGTLDCVLLFVPMSDTGNDIVARRFSVTAGSNRYSIGWNLNSNYALPLGSRTPTSIAVWYSQSNSKFYAAWKSSTQGGDIEVASSTDGATWSMVTYGLAWSAAGPSAASMWRGNDNTIVIAE